MIKTISQYIVESITQDIVYLKKYLTMSGEEKINNLPYEFTYYIRDFLEENGYNIGDYFDEDTFDCDMCDILSRNHPEILEEYGKYLLNLVNDHNLYLTDDTEYPSWSFFDNVKYIQNQWLIHFTNDPCGVAVDGFKYGVDDVSKLGLTTQLSDVEKQFGGYNFAYRADNFERYCKNRDGYKYGNQAVLFLGAGLSAWHYGDEEEQIIFQGSAAKNITPIVINDTFDVISVKTGNILFSGATIEDVVHWIIRNYDQYRKHL